MPAYLLFALSMLQLSKAFERAAPVTPACLAGTWVEIENVSTRRYLTGRDGADLRSFNPAGLKRVVVKNAEEGIAWEWRIVIERHQSQWILRSSPVWSSPTKTKLVVTPAKELLLDTQDDADVDTFYRCRCGTDRLVCLLRDHEDGNGVVFRRLSSR